MYADWDIVLLIIYINHLYSVHSFTHFADWDIVLLIIYINHLYSAHSFTHFAAKRTQHDRDSNPRVSCTRQLVHYTYHSSILSLLCKVILYQEYTRYGFIVDIRLCLT